MPSTDTPTAAVVGRRSFLKRGLLGGAAVVAASGGYLALRPGKPRTPPPRPLRSLTPEAYSIFVAVAARVIPAGEGVDPAEIVLSVDETLTYTPPHTRDEMNKALGLLENGLAGLFTRGSATPFTLLTPDEQDAALRRWRDATSGMLNAAYHGLRKLLLAAYYQSVDRARSIGYPGPIWSKPDPGPIEPRGRLSPPFVVGAVVEPKEAGHE